MLLVLKYSSLALIKPPNLSSEEKITQPFSIYSVLWYSIAAGFSFKKIKLKVHFLARVGTTLTD
jgi:hypothetical protein